jgi:hypothetical protein
MYVFTMLAHEANVELTSGANPTIVSCNASTVNKLVARCVLKIKIFSTLIKTL